MQLRDVYTIDPEGRDHFMLQSISKSEGTLLLYNKSTPRKSNWARDQTKILHDQSTPKMCGQQPLSTMRRDG